MPNTPPKNKTKYGVWICDPAPWERGHDWRVPEFFHYWHQAHPSKHGPHMALSENNVWENKYIKRRRYWVHRREKAERTAQRLRSEHPYLIVHVDVYEEEP